MKKLNAFTLAEVLLTLAIIGVVAALTLPAVITKVANDQHIIALKKAHNTLKAVEAAAIQEHGEMETWDWSLDGDEFFKIYFKPHFDILKDCEYDTYECLSEEYQRLDNSGAADPYGYGYAIMTSDGISFGYNGGFYDTEEKEYKGRFVVDVNSLKKPNQLGRDTFFFNVFPSRVGISPEGAYDSGDYTVPLSSNWVDGDCNTCNGNGHDCTAKVLTESAMDYSTTCTTSD